jgi:hypothetical protein
MKDCDDAASKAVAEYPFLMVGGCRNIFAKPNQLRSEHAFHVS